MGAVDVVDDVDFSVVDVAIVVVDETWVEVLGDDVAVLDVDEVVVFTPNM